MTEGEPLGLVERLVVGSVAVLGMVAGFWAGLSVVAIANDGYLPADHPVALTAVFVAGLGGGGVAAFRSGRFAAVLLRAFRRTREHALSVRIGVFAFRVMWPLSFLLTGALGLPLSVYLTPDVGGAVEPLVFIGLWLLPASPVLVISSWAWFSLRRRRLVECLAVMDVIDAVEAATRPTEPAWPTREA